MCSLYRDLPFHLPSLSQLIPYWGVLFHTHNVPSSCSQEHFFPSRTYFLSSIRVILRVGSPFPSEVNRKKKKLKSIKFRGHNIVGILLKYNWKFENLLDFHLIDPFKQYSLSGGQGSDWENLSLLLSAIKFYDAKKLKMPNPHF